MNNSHSTLEHLSLAERAQLRAACQEMEWRKCSANPWYFIRNYLRTQDELDPVSPYKQFPDLQYLKLLTEYLRTALVLIIVKSRQMMVTWILSAYYLWDAVFLQGRRHFLQSEDQDKSNAVLARIALLWESMPGWMKARAPAVFHASHGRLQLSRSEFIAVPQGAHAVRMYTASSLWSDEVGIQKDAAKTWKAIRPIVHGRGGARGQIRLTGTPYEGWFEVAAHDQLTTENPPGPVYIVELCEGMKVMQLASSGHTRIDLHYRADPEKRAPEWREEAHRGISEEAWEQEYELNFKIKAGRPALPMFRRHRDRIIIRPFQIPDTWPRWACADYGSTNPYSCHFYTADGDGNIYCYWEHYDIAPLGVHLGTIKSHPDFSKLEAYVLDRSCWVANQQASTSIEGQTLHQVRSIAEMHQDMGVYPIPAAVVRDSVKIAAFDLVWPKGMDDGTASPSYFIFDTNQALIEELPNIRWSTQTYAQKVMGNDPEKLIDKDNHAFDDNSYSLLHRNSPAEVPPPSMTDQEARSAESAKLREDDINKHVQQVEKDESYYDDY